MALTPSPAQGAEEWRKSHTRFSSVERQYYWNDVTADAYAAHVTAAKDAEIERLRRALREARLRLRITEEQAHLVITVWNDDLTPETDGGGK